MVVCLRARECGGCEEGNAGVPGGKPSQTGMQADTRTHTHTQASKDLQQLRAVDFQVKNLGSGLVPDVQNVPEALRGDEGHRFPCPLK